jgi:hypothetical protein
MSRNYVIPFPAPTQISRMGTSGGMSAVVRILRDRVHHYFQFAAFGRLLLSGVAFSGSPFGRSRATRAAPRPSKRAGGPKHADPPTGRPHSLWIAAGTAYRSSLARPIPIGSTNNSPRIGSRFAGNYGLGRGLPKSTIPILWQDLVITRTDWRQAAWPGFLANGPVLRPTNTPSARCGRAGRWVCAVSVVRL